MFKTACSAFESSCPLLSFTMASFLSKTNPTIRRNDICKLCKINEHASFDDFNVNDLLTIFPMLLITGNPNAEISRNNTY